MAPVDIISMTSPENENAVRVILSFEDISEAATSLRGIPYVRQYADRIEQASMAIIDQIIREFSAKERRIRELETLLDLYRRGDDDLPNWYPIEENPG